MKFTEINLESKIAQNIFKSNQLVLIKVEDIGHDEENKLRVLISKFDSVFEEKQFALPIAALQIFSKKLFETFTTDAGFQNIIKEHQVVWKYGRFTRETQFNPLVYGVLNTSPDSFYDGGRYTDMQSVISRVEKMIEAGVDIIEVGGQTTKPGFKEISPETEIERTVPYLKEIKGRFPGVALAIDTYKFPVMKAAIDYVDIINDVNGFTDDSRKLDLLAASSVGLLSMHSNRSNDYDNLTDEVHAFFEGNLKEISEAGIDQERIALDQGIGYATVADGYQDYAMMRNINQLLDFKRPIIIAISRKGFGKKLFGLEREDRLAVTLVAESSMFLSGGRILRVHDIEETVQLIKMLKTIQIGYWFKP
ncbi:dihydropteroate synthase [Pediococcus claussenii]|uniref:Dihydropteroate synthase n=1 Tax=Pediococcus claussenii (strain ATCC BAA-344 / DSM 14800 / JCM 18046 / KCTC 3811 / LMG 21948 / P06) TaxID=701521 RepID=G8PDL2_PEDCP|nr:dihydropteroate synthase [Pediococcus claussenii]AEV95347.1 dihydropteroate synthase [Pediococcus claussenii ATCC BAA-344]ANZ68879.1 dihydropteroate synthase [Pediococcus claussenii]ANZ70695.1 dihydropteroate synthase [Pediococcus claussenii]KRN18990.1 folP protein [Pediococcus claussenii]